MGIVRNRYRRQFYTNLIKYSWDIIWIFWFTIGVRVCWRLRRIERKNLLRKVSTIWTVYWNYSSTFTRATVTIRAGWGRSVAKIRGKYIRTNSTWWERKVSWGLIILQPIKRGSYTICRKMRKRWSGISGWKNRSDRFRISRNRNRFSSRRSKGCSNWS